MNREIKFRGISSFSKKWVYGYYAIIDGLPSIIEDSIEFIDGSELRSYSWDYVIPDTIGQFTGLKDKNGKEIYEGDIVRSCEYEDIKHIVSYDDKVAAFIAVCIDEYTGTDLETKCNITKEWMDKYPKVVIGNVHDNKELLNH